jgi:citrate lyase subunit beta/citryl-CoA lyase
MTAAALPVWRSLLFVPVTVRRFVDGAARRGADAIILDLEDSVAASEKARARDLVTEAAEIVSRGGADVVVRINRPWRLAVRDLEAVVGPRVQALALPKVDSAEQVRAIAEILDELEAERGMTPGATQLVAMVETVAALFRIAEIARADPRLVGLNVGAEDFALSAGIMPEADVLLMPKQLCVFAARAAGILPLGFIGTVAAFDDLDGFRETIRRSRRFGFAGASVIHPSQITILNEEFRPSPGEIAHARRVLAAYDEALAKGVGAVAVDDRMIDVPIVDRARRLIEREAVIAAREAKMRATATAASGSAI